MVLFIDHSVSVTMVIIQCMLSLFCCCCCQHLKNHLFQILCPYDLIDPYKIGKYCNATHIYLWIISNFMKFLANSLNNIFHWWGVLDVLFGESTEGLLSRMLNKVTVTIICVLHDICSVLAAYILMKLST